MPRKRSRSREVKVGFLVLVAIGVLSVGVFLIGEKNNLFSRKNDYFVRFRNVSGLAPGNPVQLNGVDVGSVRAVILPEEPERLRIRVELAVDRRYAERIRSDSEARIKTLGLLGDKYVEITTGSVDQPIIPSGSEIPAAEATALDALMESGEDVMSNVTEISSALKTILGRMEKGEGLLGELVSPSATGETVSGSVISTMQSIQEVARKVETGDGLLPRLITDPTFADQVRGAVDRLDAAVAKLEGGEGLLPALMEDAGPREDFAHSLGSLREASDNLATFARDLNEGEGLLAKLLADEEYAEELTRELKETVDNLNELTRKLNEGDGTVAQLVNDPQIYDAVNDVIVGVNESKLLRWLIRNRQKAGIKKRYRDAREAEATAAAPPG